MRVKVNKSLVERCKPLVELYVDALGNFHVKLNQSRAYKCCQIIKISKHCSFYAVAFFRFQKPPKPDGRVENVFRKLFSVFLTLCQRNSSPCDKKILHYDLPLILLKAIRDRFSASLVERILKTDIFSYPRWIMEILALQFVFHFTLLRSFHVKGLFLIETVRQL